MLNLDNYTTEIAGLIEEAVNHPYMLDYIDRPEIDHIKLELLLRLFDKAEMPYEEVREIAVAAMLVQIALDIHDKVTLSAEGEETSEFQKSRQVTVLAGDYFSGLYYQILAAVNKVSYISSLSAAIREINEHKIHLYQSFHKDSSDLLSSIRIIEAALILRAADEAGEPELGALFAEILLLKRLYEERQLLNEGLQSPFIIQLARLSQTGEDISKCAENLDSLIGSVIHTIQVSSAGREWTAGLITRFEKLGKKC
ncbi:heptaprenyl diphosphate synthase component 1 [Peribacillus sp. SCS-37]|uniref:heptaprenyl diphosphate synthase component 1 n=1 Tax=Paraperibacillus esterisolvens TaxID=3115296 RepID=UPI0039059F36